MEHDAVVLAALGQGDEVAGGDRRRGAVDLEHDGALRRLDRDRPLLTGRSAAGWAVGQSPGRPMAPRPAGAEGAGDAADERRRGPMVGAPADAGCGAPGEDRREQRPPRPPTRRADVVGNGSCGSLQGSGEVDGPGQQRLAEDEAGDAGIAQP